MNTSKASNQSYMKTQTVIFLGVGLFIAGYLAGMSHTIYRSLPTQDHAQHAPAEMQDEHDHPEDNAKMEAALVAATKKNPQNVEAWIQLGHIFFDRDRYQEAIDAYQKALAVNPQNPDVITNMGVMYRRSKQPQKALEAFEQAITVDPNHEIARFNKGIVLMHDLNDPKGAIQAWEALQAVNPMATAPNGLSLADMIKQYQQQEKN